MHGVRLSLSVCLSVCQQLYVKTTERIFVKILGNAYGEVLCLMIGVYSLKLKPRLVLRTCTSAYCISVLQLCLSEADVYVSVCLSVCLRKQNWKTIEQRLMELVVGPKYVLRKLRGSD